MKTHVEQKVVVVLEMTEDEAKWLKNMMHNPIVPDEDHQSAEMRKRFWECLNGIW